MNGMFKDFFATVSRIVSFIMSVIVAVILGFATWASWLFYEDQQVQKKFVNDGQPVTVTVVHADQKQKSWRDLLSNSTYLTVRYRNKDYTTRYVMSTRYVGSGDEVNLLYHPDYDAFRQPEGNFHVKRETKKSRLIDWTTASTASDDNLLLLLCLALSTASFFVISGVIATIMPVPFLQDLARLVMVIVLCIGAVFFTYDTWNYYEYYHKLKSQGQQVTVKVLDTDRIAPRYSGRHGVDCYEYDYQATTQHQQQERIIPISADDYERLKPGDSLEAFYNSTMNDFMSVDFPPKYGPIAVPLFFAFLVFLFVRNGFFKRK